MNSVVIISHLNAKASTLRKLGENCDSHLGSHNFQGCTSETAVCQYFSLSLKICFHYFQSEQNGKTYARHYKEFDQHLGLTVLMGLSKMLRFEF